MIIVLLSWHASNQTAHGELDSLGHWAECRHAQTANSQVTTSVVGCASARERKKPKKYQTNQKN